MPRAVAWPTATEAAKSRHSGGRQRNERRSLGTRQPGPPLCATRKAAPCTLSLPTRPQAAPYRPETPKTAPMKYGTRMEKPCPFWIQIGQSAGFGNISLWRQGERKGISGQVCRGNKMNEPLFFFTDHLVADNLFSPCWRFLRQCFYFCRGRACAAQARRSLQHCRAGADNMRGPPGKGRRLKAECGAS